MQNLLTLHADGFLNTFTVENRLFARRAFALYSVPRLCVMIVGLKPTPGLDSSCSLSTSAIIS